MSTVDPSPAARPPLPGNSSILPRPLQPRQGRREGGGGDARFLRFNFQNGGIDFVTSFLIEKY